MTFDQTHVYWTFHWTVDGVADEAGQIGIRTTTPGTPPTLTTVDEVGDAFSTFWITESSGVGSRYRFYRVKAAVVLPDGHYDPDFDAVVDDRSPVGGGSFSATPLFPLQVAHSLQLTTDRTSGPAHAGRVFLPPVNGALGNDFLASPSAVGTRVANFAAFLDGMNAAVGEEAAVVMSAKGAGTTRVISGVRADNRLDVQRRRARQQPSVWSAVSPVD